MFRNALETDEDKNDYFQKNDNFALGEEIKLSGVGDEQPSIWQGLFNGLKNLFNMNEEPEVGAGGAAGDYNDFLPVHLRQSVHRTRHGDHMTGSPSVIKGRSSFLPNA